MNLKRIHYRNTKAEFYKRVDKHNATIPERPEGNTRGPVQGRINRPEELFAFMTGLLKFRRQWTAKNKWRVTRSYIKMHAGISEPTVDARLKQLIELGIIEEKTIGQEDFKNYKGIINCLEIVFADGSYALEEPQEQQTSPETHKNTKIAQNQERRNVDKVEKPPLIGLEAMWANLQKV
jgi:hypothetical protein